MKQHMTDGINGWHFARHTATCNQCDMAADAVSNGTGGLELHVDTIALCDVGSGILEMRETGDPDEEAKSN